MHTLHIGNKVEDYELWKAAFDKFDRVRRDGGVLAYRITRPAEDPSRIDVDLDFTTRDEARGFIEVLAKIWRTPQSQAVLADHGTPQVHDVLEQRSLR
ncbi:hypothetical protein [Amycolatopsis jejuensis]|uniref:hypothetical protein n=1 Tax=Amycolatopsis jejuensis TaxID=330084 RepID=UPI000524EE49|nr:hypothetical protein [Amycolatopsis jejuensis]